MHGIKGRSFAIVIHDDSPHAKVVREMFGPSAVLTVPRDPAPSAHVLEGIDYSEVERRLVHAVGGYSMSSRRRPVAVRRDDLLAEPPTDDLADMRAMMRELRGLPRNIHGVHGAAVAELRRQGAHGYTTEVRERRGVTDVVVRRPRAEKSNARFVDLRALERAMRRELPPGAKLRVRMG